LGTRGKTEMEEKGTEKSGVVLGENPAIKAGGTKNDKKKQKGRRDKYLAQSEKGIHWSIRGRGVGVDWT